MLDYSDMKPSDRFYFRMAYTFAEFASQDPVSQVGAVIARGDTEKDYMVPQILSLGANRFPEYTKITEELLQRENKYKHIIHAERNAIFTAAKLGRQTAGAVMYCPWACCLGCAQAIIDSGILIVYVHKEAQDRTPERWKSEIDEAILKLASEGVQYTSISGKVGQCTNLFDGQIWEP